MNVRPMIAGGVAALSLLATLAGGVSAWVPTASVLGPLARMLDAYAPWLLGIGLALAALTMALQAWRTGAVLALICVVAGIAQVSAYRDLTRPADSARAPDLQVLFFNAFAQNGDNGTRIVEAAVATGADILVFAEAEALLGEIDALEAAYAFVSPCRGETCELLIATNLPVLRSWQLQLNPGWAERYAVLEVDLPGRGPVFVAASHLAKPWMSGLAEPELAQLTAQLNWLTGPSVVIGDFNMPPWSGPMRELLQETGFFAPRLGPGTWPASALPALRLPIDHVLVRGGTTLTSLTPFGADLGSNHLGFLAGIALP